MSGRDRREFLKSSAPARSRPVCRRGPLRGRSIRRRSRRRRSAIPRYREWSAVALAEAKRLGCSYADIRFTRNRSQSLTLRNGQIFAGGGRFGGDGFGGRGGGGTVETYGFGIRVIHGGVWGFASSPVVTPDEIKRVAAVATDIARASAIAKKTDVRLAPVEKYDEYWQMPFEKDPWSVPLEEKVELLRGVTSAIQKTPGILFANATAGFEYEWKYLATSEGSFIEQLFHFCNCSASATARTGTQVKTRNYEQAAGGGYEFLVKCDLPGQADRIAAEAIEHSKAKPVGQGVKDLVLMPSHLALTIHEIVAHATELDRIAGYEANYAGTSFVKIADIGKLKYGSPKFNVTADRTFPGGHGHGRLRRRRGEGAEVADRQGRHARRAADQPRDRAPRQRELQPRLHLRQPLAQLSVPAHAQHPARGRARPGSPDVDAMIADVKDGVLVDGMGSFSIDQQRYNGQFGGDAFWEIKNGKKTRMVTDFTYNAITTDFWANLDAVGPPGVGARGHDRRRQGSAGAVESSVARLVAVPHPQDHGRRGVRVAAPASIE